MNKTEHDLKYAQKVSSKSKFRSKTVLLGVSSFAALILCLVIAKTIEGTESTIEEPSADDLARITKFANENENKITLVVVTKPYIDITLSWICNVREGGFMPKGLLFLTTDSETYNVLVKIPDTKTIMVRSLNGGTYSTGTEYKTPGYWRLMLDRTMLISALLDADIDVFLVETDAVWLKDPMRIISNYTDIEQKPDVLGIMQSDNNVNGGFLYIHSTDGTKAMYKDIKSRFKNEFIVQGMLRSDPSYRKGIKNDQTYLTHFMLRVPSSQTNYNVRFHELDPREFVLGNWYEKNGFYGINSVSPTVINNNFIIGIDNKIARARRFGHWFLDDKTQKCLPLKVIDAIQKNEKAYSELMNQIRQVLDKPKDEDSETRTENIAKELYDVVHGH